MNKPWDILDRPEADTLLAAIAQHDAAAAALARQVWEQVQTQPDTKREWLDILANAVLSFQHEGQSRLGSIAQMHLAELEQRGF